MKILWGQSPWTPLKEEWRAGKRGEGRGQKGGREGREERERDGKGKRNGNGNEKERKQREREGKKGEGKGYLTHLHFQALAAMQIKKYCHSTGLEKKLLCAFYNT